MAPEGLRAALLHFLREAQPVQDLGRAALSGRARDDAHAVIHFVQATLGLLSVERRVVLQGLLGVLQQQRIPEVPGRTGSYPYMGQIKLLLASMAQPPPSDLQLLIQLMLIGPQLHQLHIRSHDCLEGRPARRRRQKTQFVEGGGEGKEEEEEEEKERGTLKSSGGVQNTPSSLLYHMQL